MKKLWLFIFVANLLFCVGCSQHSDPISSIDRNTSLQKSKTKNTVQDQPDQVESNTYIPLVLVLFENDDYSGPRRIFVEETPDLLGNVNFNDKASSAIVYAGPNYAAYKSAHNGAEPTVTLYSNASYTGSSIVLKVGKYSSLNTYSMNDVVSSVNFLNGSNALTPDAQPDFSFGNIHTVLRLYQNSNQGGYYITILGTTSSTEYENISDFVSFFGVNDFASSYNALAGPNATSNYGVRLWADANYSGSVISLYPSSIGNFSTSQNDIFSAAQSLNNN